MIVRAGAEVYNEEEAQDDPPYCYEDCPLDRMNSDL